MKAPSQREGGRMGEHGMALVITLSFIVLLTVLVVAYLTTMRLDRLSTQNYSQSVRAQELAQGALEEIKDDLLMEIEAGSLPDGMPAGTTYTQNGVRTYMPASALSSQPARMGFTAADYTTDVDATRLPPTVLRVSRSGLNMASVFPAADYPGGTLPVDRTSPADTDEPSANGRRISAERWNKPKIMGEDPPSVFSDNPPEWIYITRDGTGNGPYTDADVGTLKPNPDLADENQVLGRYAYVIYDQGGLIDVNVAGYPTTWSPSTSGAEGAAVRGKAALAYADLMVLPGMSGKETVLDAFLDWRSLGAVTLWSGFLNAIGENFKLGFLTFQPGDSPLLSRQDLIDYFGDKFGTAEPLAYLGTFSRASTAPSWKPRTPTGSSVDYAGNAENTASENRNLPNVRVAAGKAFTRPDGTAAVVGDPLLNRRFPLSRIGLLTDATTNAAQIQSFFGLSWSGSYWTYDHGDANNIMTLAEVADAGREPDFFELLKAVILNASLGRDPGYTGPGRIDGGSPTVNYPYAEVWGQQSTAPYNTPSGAYFDTYSSIPDSQIIQIGANIIDQYDEDSLPTAVLFDAVQVNPDSTSSYLSALFNLKMGIENLPYMTSVRPLSWRNGSANTHRGWFQPAVWNPHEPPPSGYSGTRPTGFRIHAYGAARIQDWSGGVPAVFYYDDNSTATPDPSGAQYITFTDPGGGSSPFYTNPVFLTTANAASPDSRNMYSSTYSVASNVGQFVAFYAGDYTPGDTTGGNSMIIGSNHPTTTTFVMEYTTDGSTWRPYAMMARYNAFCGGGSNVSSTVSTQGNFDIGRIDPRTDRFSGFMGWPNINNNTYWPSGTTYYRATAFTPRRDNGSYGFTYTQGSTTVGLFSTNLQSSGTYYEDPDGVVRPADAYRGSNTTGYGRPTYNGGMTTGRRPVVLNRPFRSVAELGYVFRDLPFKSLDFWSESSADAGLLDVFCVDTEPVITAGQINPNSAPAPVLEAVLAGTAKREADSAANIAYTGTGITEAEALSVAIATYIRANGNLRDRADLVIKDNGGASLSAALQAAFTTNADKENKNFGEAPVRALAPVTNTRTWNLLIDVVAQSGRMAPNAADLDDFMVEGEKRYWLHLALDRYTGEVIDQQLEPVYE